MKNWKVLFIGMVVLCWSVGVEGQTVFGPSGIIATNTIITGAKLVTVDLDGDGDLDILGRIKSDNPTLLAWYKNNGNGNFSSQGTIVASSNDFGVMDVDNDGDYDIIITISYDLVWLPNDGNGNFGAEQIIDGTSSFEEIAYSIIRIADYDYDGDDDIFASHYDMTTIKRYENYGDGTFGESTAAYIDYSIRDILVENLYEDNGILDLTYLNSVSYFIDGGWVYDVKITMRRCAQPDCSTAQIFIIDEFNESSGGLMAEDMDGDGDLDIINASMTNVGWYQNNDGYFSERQIIITDTSEFPIAYGFQSFDCGDLDNDGDIDVISSYPYYGTRLLAWYENDGNGNFSEPKIISLENNLDSPMQNDVHLSDLDEDGDNDILFPRLYSGILWKENYLENFFSLSGTTYWDRNNNGDYDEGEPVLNGNVQIEPGYLSLLPNNGEYQAYLEPGEYVVSPDVSSFWTLSSDSAYYQVSSDTIVYLTGYDFGFIPNDTIVKTQGVINSDPPVCDQMVSFHFIWQNTGTTILDGIVTATIDPWVQSINYNGCPPDSVLTDHKFQWNFTDLLPGHTITKTIYLEMPGIIDGFEIGDALNNTMNVYSVNQDNPEEWSSTTTRYQPEILCAYDPNDKLVIPARDMDNGNPTLPNEPLAYTIRFQNTGNYFAADVIIRDTLSDHLDPATLRIMGSSHADVLTTTLEEDKYLTFSFINIMLPDSTLDFEGSQGYVSYIIEPYLGLDTGTEIENTAHIYFDFNPAIVTNTTQNTLTDTIYQLVDETGCNSFFYDGIIYYESVEFNDSLCIYGGCIITQGDITVHEGWSEEQQAVICYGESYSVGTSIYIYPGVYEDIFIRENGCDSIIITSLTVLPTLQTTPKIDICEGESYSVGTSTYTESGVYVDTLIAQNGCDSTITTILTVHPETQTDIQVTINDQGETHTLPDGTEVSQAGVYQTVLESWQGCDSIVVTTVQVSTGIWEFEDGLDFSVFPNPSSQDFHIELSGGSQGEYRLEAYDMLGRRVHSSFLSCPTSPRCRTTVAAADWPAGIYTLALRDTDGRLLGTAKVIRE